MANQILEGNAQLIYEAVFYKNEELLRELLKLDPNRVHFRDKHGRSAVHLAAQNGTVEILDLLISCGADVNSMAGPSALCATPLHVAASAGQTEAVRRLIEAGAELLATDLRDHCALELAQMANHFETACLLIDAIEMEREQIKQMHDGLIGACVSGDVNAVVKILPNLVAKNSDPVLNGTTLDRKSALYLACLNGQREVVEALLNVRGHNLIQPTTHDTILHAAISSQEVYIVEMILKTYTHLVTTKNVDGSTCLHWATQCGNLNVVKLLLEFAYDDDVLSKVEDISGRFSYRFVLDVNALDAQCRTALYLAVANSHYDVVKYLLETRFPTIEADIKCPFQVDVYCSGGKTPLMVAAANGNIPLVKLLLEHGADVNLPCGLTDADISSLDGARCIGSGALNEACRIGSLPLAQLLFQEGAVDHENVALATAFKSKQDALVRLLLMRLAFVDPEYRVNKRGVDFGQMTINRSFLPSSVYPTTPCMLNWHNTSMINLFSDWLVAACLQVNQRLRTSRTALAALTRIDISKNKLTVLNSQLLQLPSLRSLNAANNEITKIEMVADGLNAPLLENLSLEYNELTYLPNDLFSLRLPILNALDVSHNKLVCLPETVWMAPRLRELNASHNCLKVIPEVSLRQTPSFGAVSNDDQKDTIISNRNTHSTEDSLSIGARADDSNITIHELKRHNVWQTSIKLVQSDDSDTENGTNTSSSALSVLNLSHNNIKVLPQGLACCCPRLTRLNISNNLLTSLGPLQCIPSGLRHMDVSANSLVVAFERSSSIQLVCHSLTAQANGVTNLCQPSPTRLTRSRSKSAVRSQRSLSVARAGEALGELRIVACSHKQHSRLESLRTFQASNNRLTQIPISAQISAISSPKKRPRDRHKDNKSRQILLPSLTTLDLSCNLISNIPKDLSKLTSLSVLNLSGNVGIEMLPPELGLLGKLWNLNLRGCSLRDPLRSMIQVENFKTADLIAYLKSVLEDSRPYTRLKLMIVGVQGIGKTSLLQQLRLEGTVGKRTTPNDSWSKRMGQNVTAGDRTAKGTNMSTVGVDIAEWTFEPKKTRGETSFGPITFRTWDFGGQREYYATHQYFLSRRSLYILVWKVTNGEAAFSDLHQWLVNIQARAPNSPVIIVGTHVDQVFSSPERFPGNYLEELNAIIRERFLMIPDADKKGLPRVIESMFVSTKTKQNIRSLCNLLYQTALEMKSSGSKERLLEQKIPASYLAFEKIVTGLADERRHAGIEPVMTGDEFRSVIQKRMLKIYGRALRDDIEFNHACSFLHENGVLLHYEDVTLRELYFLDPQWLCDILAHVITIREINPFARNGLMKIDDLQILFKALKHECSTMNLRSHIISLLQKFEVALVWQSRSLLIPSLLPDEYQLRGGYPGSRVTVRSKVSGWQLRNMEPERKPLSNRFSRLQPKALIYQQSLGDVHIQRKALEVSKKGAEIAFQNGQSANDQQTHVHIKEMEQQKIRRVYLMAYIPSGFWSRLMARVLVDEHITGCMQSMLMVEFISQLSSLDTLVELCNKNYMPEWLLWQTGFQMIAFGETLLTVRQFLPLAEVKDVHYEQLQWRTCGDDEQWRVLDIRSSSVIEIVIPSVRINVIQGKNEYVLRSDRTAATRLLSLAVNIMDTLLEDWYPSLGTRFVHTSEGRLLVNRLVPCIHCTDAALNSEAVRKTHNIDQHRKSQTINDLSEVSKIMVGVLHAFTVEECILSAHDGSMLHCPLHGDIAAEMLAPDTAFLDISCDYLVRAESIKRGKLLGRGAFGFVFKAALKIVDQSVVDVAMKMLEPVEPGLGARVTSVSAYKAALGKWQREPLQSACRAYCTCRQELDVLTPLQHTHIIGLIGICPRPLALLVELAPLGALNNLLSNYKRSAAHLNLSVIQDTASQVAKALEYLHEHRIIYRDLKCENVLAWKFPPPFSAMTDVLIKLGDYGISRSSFPSGGAKGFGGTEGFMAPEILRYNGEQEYTEKVDCFSFAMFLYELISLKLPFDGHEQLKEYVLDGGRPKLTPSELLYPCNVLDVMVVCWATQPIDRPSASQIVSMTTAPEFTHLLDVISLNDPDSAVHCGLSFSTVDDIESGPGFEDIVEGEVWLSRSDGSISVIGCNQYGWLDSKSMIVGSDRTFISAMCVINNVVWLAESTGLIRVYCRSSYLELWSFSISRFLSTPQLSVNFLALSVFSTGPTLILATLPNCLMLLHGEKTAENMCVSCVTIPTCYSSTVIDFGSNSRQVWIGQEKGVISVYNTSFDHQIIHATDIHHHEAVSGVMKIGKVSHLITSKTDNSLLWSSLSPGSKIYLWCTTSHKIQGELDARKILPSSESLSTLDIEAACDGHVSALALLDRADGAQLYIGTNRGVVIVAQAFQMRPLAAFRPYLDDVHSIIVLDTTQALNEYLKNRREASATSGTSIGGRTFGAISSSSGSELLETVSWMKERVSETVNRFRNTLNESSIGSNSYVITIGNGYRCLIDRFTDRKHQSAVTPRRESHCAIIWRTDDWTP